MRPLTTTAALAAAAMSLLASPGATRHPIAVTRSATLAAVSSARPGSAEPACHEPTDAHSGAAREHTVSDISWFQGTLEEAFTRHAHKDHRPLLHF
jgi:hypothetical protein